MTAKLVAPVQPNPAASEMWADPAVLWDLGDRLRKALRIGQITTEEMAEYLGVARSTISQWQLCRSTPNTGMMRLWASYCGVSFEWLSEGVGAAGNLRAPSGRGKLPEPTSIEDLLVGCAARDSNPEPAD